MTLPQKSRRSPKYFHGSIELIRKLLFGKRVTYSEGNFERNVLQMLYGLCNKSLGWRDLGSLKA